MLVPLLIKLACPVDFAAQLVFVVRWTLCFAALDGLAADELVVQLRTVAAARRPAPGQRMLDHHTAGNRLVRTETYLLLV